MSLQEIIEWVPVDEAAPEDDLDVLLLDADDDIWPVWPGYYRSEDASSRHSGYRYADGDLAEPTHWAPMPRGPGAEGASDPLYQKALEIVRREGRGSLSMLQRHLAIGYCRADRLIRAMVATGILGEPQAGTACRLVKTGQAGTAPKGGAA